MAAAVIAVRIVVFRTEMHGGSSHLVGGYEQQALLVLVSHGHPSHFLLRAVLLGQDIVFLLVFHRAVIGAGQTGFLAVAVAVPRTTAEPAQLLHR